MNWEKYTIKLDSGCELEAIAPVIISASRSTDIPAFYSPWLIHRLKRGYVAWTNPFNRVVQYVSFANARLFVFWSKNPAPIIPFLNKLDQSNVNYYFQFTLNDYILEQLEPNVPDLTSRIETFKKLSDIIGKEKIIWRFDPVLMSDKLDMNALLGRIKNIGNRIHPFTEKLVFSFADITMYRKVQTNLVKDGGGFREFHQEEMIEFAQKLSEVIRIWGLKLATCCEEVALEEYGIRHNRCIDDELIVRLFPRDVKLMSWLGYSPGLFKNRLYITNSKLKDKGQRNICGCIISKDIGMYNTCNHLCRYCYANTSASIVKKNILSHSKDCQSII